MMRDMLSNTKIIYMICRNVLPKLIQACLLYFNFMCFKGIFAISLISYIKIPSFLYMNWVTFFKVLSFFLDASKAIWACFFLCQELVSALACKGVSYWIILLAALNPVAKSEYTWQTSTFPLAQGLLVFEFA